MSLKGDHCVVAQLCYGMKGHFKNPWSRSMSDRYARECMVFDNQHHNGVEKPMNGYQNRDIGQALIFRRYLNGRESLNTLLMRWVNLISEHIHTKVVLPRYEGSYMVYKLEWYKKT